MIPQLPGVAAAVRRLRANFGESKRQFAIRLGVAPSTVVRWEKGRFVPSVSSLILMQKIARHYGFEWSETVDESKDFTQESPDPSIPPAP